MEQPPEEAPEARPEEEKEEAAKAEGAPELNGGPEHSLPSSSYTGEGGPGTQTESGRGAWPAANSVIVGGRGAGWLRAGARQPGATPRLCCSSAAGSWASCLPSSCRTWVIAGVQAGFCGN